MTLKTFFKNLFAPGSEVKPLPAPLDLRLLEHYEAWQKKTVRKKSGPRRKSRRKSVNTIESSSPMRVRMGSLHNSGSLTKSSPRARACVQPPLRNTTNG